MTDVGSVSPEEVAARVGLSYVSDEQPGITRRRSGRGFSYRGPDGVTVARGEVRDRIDALVIPPAWTDVWICPDPDGHLQATGRDERGRKQYRYHDRWRAERDAEKFERLGAFGARLPRLRKAVDADLATPGLRRERVLALVVRLLDETLIRIGNEAYALENESYGLTTLRRDHVEVAGSEVVFDFVGKGGTEHEIHVHDRRLARLITECDQLDGCNLFSYDDSGKIAGVTSDDVNAYLRQVAGPDVTAKVFRTWGATVVAAEELVRPVAGDDGGTEADADARILAAIDAAAERLGNTRAVSRASYVHPGVPEAFRSGDLDAAWARSRRTASMSRAERTVVRLLG